MRESDVSFQFFRPPVMDHLEPHAEEPICSELVQTSQPLPFLFPGFCFFAKSELLSFFRIRFEAEPRGFREGMVPSRTHPRLAAWELITTQLICHQEGKGHSLCFFAGKSGLLTGA